MAGSRPWDWLPWAKLGQRLSAHAVPKNYRTYSAWGKVSATPYFFSFFVSGQPASVNDVQGINPQKWSFRGLPSCGGGLHIKVIISEPFEGYWGWPIGAMRRYINGPYCIFRAWASMSNACLRVAETFPQALYIFAVLLRGKTERAVRYRIWRWGSWFGSYIQVRIPTAGYPFPTLPAETRKTNGASKELALVPVCPSNLVLTKHCTQIHPVPWTIAIASI